MCKEEAGPRVDAVVSGEAENVWARLLADAARGRLEHLYEGGLADITRTPPARHDLLPAGYALGAIQTTRGCPLSCRLQRDGFQRGTVSPATHPGGY